MRALIGLRTILRANSKLAYKNPIACTFNAQNSQIASARAFSALNKNVVCLGSRALHTSSWLQNDSAEKIVGNSQKYEFLAETKQLLNIVAKSLYSEKEVFIRELVSNSSDAIEKLKYNMLSQPADAQQSDIPYEISISCNDLTNTLVIQVNKINNLKLKFC